MRQINSPLTILSEAFEKILMKLHIKNFATTHFDAINLQAKNQGATT